MGTEASASDGGWVIYDTTGSYAIENPERVEHLIVMLPKDQMAERGVRLGELMARHVGGASGISRVALETMRSTYQELPHMSEDTARGAGEMTASRATSRETCATRSCRSMASRARSTAAGATCTTHLPATAKRWPAISSSSGCRPACVSCATTRPAGGPSPRSRCHGAFPVPRISAACFASARA